MSSFLNTCNLGPRSRLGCGCNEPRSVARSAAVLMRGQPLGLNDDHLDDLFSIVNTPIRGQFYCLYSPSSLTHRVAMFAKFRSANIAFRLGSTHLPISIISNCSLR